MGLPPHFSARPGRRRPDGMDSLGMPRTLSRGGLRYPRDVFGRGRHYIWEGVFNGANITVLCAAYPEANGAAEISRNQAIFTASFKCRRELMREIPPGSLERPLRAQKRPTVGAGGRRHGQFGWSAAFGDFAFMRLILTRPRAGRNPKIRRMAVGDS